MLTGRAIALLAACALSFQALGVPMPMASCCCAQKSAKCHCPVCTHAREIESGCRFLQGCAPSAPKAMVTTASPVLPAVLRPAVVKKTAFALPGGPSPSEPPDPTVDVPTPPPLQG